MASKMDTDKDYLRLMAATYGNRRTRAMIELQGLSRAILADEIVTDSEVEVLRVFLVENAEFLDQWPLSDLAVLMKRILADGVVDHSERLELIGVLRQFCLKSGEFKNSAPDAIFDDGVDVWFPGRRVLVTGKMEFSQRKPFHARLTAVGAIVQEWMGPAIDYLVVGEKGSAMWTTGRYGSKIDAAMQYRRAGDSQVLIIRESIALISLMKAERELLLQPTIKLTGDAD